MGKRTILFINLIIFYCIFAFQKICYSQFQEGKSLRNSTLLPFLTQSEEKLKNSLLASIKNKDYSRAAKVTLKLLELPKEKLIKINKRWGIGIFDYLSLLFESTSPKLLEKIEELTTKEAKFFLKYQNADKYILRKILEKFPFNPSSKEFLIRLADFYLEEGKARSAFSVLMRSRFIHKSFKDEKYIKRLLLRNKEAENILQRVSANLDIKDFKAVELTLLKKVEFRFSSIKQNIQTNAEWKSRGILKPRGCVAKTNDTVWLNDGENIWEINLSSKKIRRAYTFRISINLGEDASAYLAKDISNYGDKIIAIAGPRPAPGSLPENHRLICFKIVRKGETKNLIPLWEIKGRLNIPENININKTDKHLLKKGPISFGAGPLWVEGDVITLLYIPLDKTRVSAYLSRISGRTGKPKWVVFLAQGAPEAIDPLFDRLSAMPFPRVKGAPLVLDKGEVFVGTDLGTIHVLDSLSGRPIYAFKVERTKKSAGEANGFLDSRVFATNHFIVAALKDSDWIYVLKKWPSMETPLFSDPIPRGKISILVGAKRNSAFFITSQEGEFSLLRINIPKLESYLAPPLQEGEHFVGVPLVLNKKIIFSSENIIYSADIEKDLYLNIIFEKEEDEFSYLGLIIPIKNNVLTIGYEGIGFFKK